MRSRGLKIFFPAMVFIMACVLSSMAHSGESLNCNKPRGWQILTDRKDSRVSTMEMIPDGESSSRWTEMITVQTFHGRSDTLPSQWLESLQTCMRKTCPSISFSKVALFRDNGLSAARMMIYRPNLSECAYLPLALHHRKGEITYIKAIRGMDHFYVIQRTWRGEVFEDPSRSDMPRQLMCEWLKFFEAVQVDAAR